MDRPYEKWKPNMKVIKAIIQYVIKKRRFQLKAIVREEIEVAEEAEAVEGAEMGM